MILDLSVILEGDEGCIFYSPCFGKVELISVCSEYIKVNVLNGEKAAMTITFNTDGTYNAAGELMIYPEYGNTDWDEYYYVKQHCPGWSEYCKNSSPADLWFFDTCIYDLKYSTPLEKAVVAYIKLTKIIKRFYNTAGKNIECVITPELYVEELLYNMNTYKPLLFTSVDDANNFLKNKSNIQLVKDLYQ